MTIEEALTEIHRQEDVINRARRKIATLGYKIKKEFGLVNTSLPVIDARRGKWTLEGNSLVFHYIDHVAHHELVKLPEPVNTWPTIRERNGRIDILAIPAHDWDGNKSLFIVSRDVPDYLEKLQ